MKSEASLQTRIQKHMRDNGFLCEHLEPAGQPGWPDLTVIRGKSMSLIEVKDFSQIGRSEKFSAVFTDSQPPFYLKCLKHDIFPFVVGLLEADAVFFQITTVHMVTEIFESTREEYLRYYATNLEDTFDWWRLYP